jgi:3-oxoadipate enol-lactonase
MWLRRIEIVPFISIGGVTLHHRYIEATGMSCQIIFII